MTISLIGSHRTGKTTVYQLLKEKHPEHVYFPTGTFSLNPDAMRPDDLAYQHDVDHNISVALNTFVTDKKKIHYIKTNTIDERVDEISRIMHV